MAGMISRAFWEYLTRRDQTSRGPLRLSQFKSFFDPRQRCLDTIEANRLLRKLDLDMSKVGLHMREGCFKVTDTYGQIVQPPLDSINGGTHVPKMFENQVFDVFRRGRSLSSREKCAMIEDKAMSFKHAAISCLARSGFEAASN
jgi:hypothetical protein